ncbi:MAG TPA: hypothetical protein VFP93_04290 [Gammaproteobacteria bacterium]|nr:hypothetical protein [Gammaproteobacteria bacterium]
MLFMQAVELIKNQINHYMIKKLDLAKTLDPEAILSGLLARRDEQTQGIMNSQAKPSYLERLLRFNSELTWEKMMQCDFATFRSILNNNLTQELVVTNKLMVLARLKYQLQTKLEESKLQFQTRQSQSTLENVKTAEQASLHECIDEQLIAFTLKNIEEAEALLEVARSQSSQKIMVSQISVTAMPGNTELLLQACKSFIREFYHFCDDIDRKYNRLPGSMYALRDYLPDQAKLDHPIVLTQNEASKYILHNLWEEAKQVQVKEKPKNKYLKLGGLLELGQDLWKQIRHDPQLACNKRELMYRLFENLSNINTDQTREEIQQQVLNVIDTHYGSAKSYTPLRSLVSHQAIEGSFHKIHETLLEKAPDAVKIQHMRSCNFT